MVCKLHNSVSTRQVQAKFKDEKLVAAIEEERITRVKHAAGFPINSIKFCLDFAKLNLSDIDYVAINRNPNLRVFNKLIYALKYLENILIYHA